MKTKTQLKAGTDKPAQFTVTLYAEQAQIVLTKSGA
jgi:hypothetical protein